LEFVTAIGVPYAAGAKPVIDAETEALTGKGLPDVTGEQNGVPSVQMRTCCWA
jgi:hypothetical protein